MGGKLFVRCAAGSLLFLSALVAHADSASSASKKEIVLESAIRSDACSGSCASAVGYDGSTFFRVRDPSTGAVFKTVPLDATLGPLLSSQSNLDNDVARYSAGAPASKETIGIQDIPSPPPGGSGTVTETYPFHDPTGSGNFVVTYVFYQGVLQDIVTTKVYVRPW
ncbi:MAG TPA: hypothetical protein VGC30_09455 [Dokdonella sp.]